MRDVYERKYGDLLDEHEEYKTLSTKIIAEQRAEVRKLRRNLDNIKVRSYELGQKELHAMAWEALKWDEPIVKLYTPYPGHCMKISNAVFRHLCNNDSPCC